MKIAIDGPAGSGKSTVAKKLSKTLSIPYLDTGSLYRTFGYIAKKKAINLNSIKEVLSLFEEDIKVELRIACMRVLYEGREIGDEIRTEEIGRYASILGSYPEFRERINEFFRKLVGDSQVVAEGRDVGTHIFPEAPVKFFITASVEERAKRRYLQLLSLGKEVNYEEVLREITERDKRDAQRPKYPFRPAKDAIIIDTTNLSEEEVLEKMLKIVNEVSLRR